MYTIEPGESVQVESQPDPTGLKIGLVYDCSMERKELLYQRFVCKNESVLTISEIDYEEISWFGENITGMLILICTFLSHGRPQGIRRVKFGSLIPPL